MNIWILDSDSGITLLYKSYLDLSLDEDLVSGLLAALNQFTVFEFQEGIESIDMGGLRWVYLEDKQANLLFVAAAEKNVSSNTLKAQLNSIKQAFLEKYVSCDVEKWKTMWKGNTELFTPFKETIAQYYSDWLGAKGVTDIAKHYNFLGVSQQVLNYLINVVEAHIKPKQKHLIYSRIEIMFLNYLNSDYVKKNPELTKFSFDRTSGINIITINPAKCDMIVVEKQVINLIRRIVEMIREDAGSLTSLKFFIEEKIFEYITSEITLLNELNLLKFLLTLFLLD